MSNDQPLATDNLGAIRVLTMTGVPRRGNPMSSTLAGLLLAAVADAASDDTVRSLVLAGWLDDLDTLRHSSKPIIAAVRGHAVGGGFELALYCDLIVAADDAQFALPETGIGVIAGQGGSQRLAALAGRAVAADLILTGRVLSGREAGAYGIAARVVANADVLDTAIMMAQAIAERSAPAVRFAREVLFESSEGPLRQSLRIERLLAALVLDTPEAHERIGAFFNRKC